MATELESLQISINAKAKSANQAIDSLVGRLDILSKSLGKINRGSSNISGLANGVDKLGRAMQTMNSVSTADFTRLATNLEKMGKINVASLNSAASSMSHLSRALSTLSGVSANSTQIVDVANSIGKLGGVSVQRAITNMPQLASAMNNLMTTLSRSPQVSRNLIDMTNALANLASQGQRISTATNSMVNGLGNTDRAVRRTSKSTLSLAATFGKFYASYFLVIRGMKSLWRSIESTADYFEAFNYFNVAMTKIGSDWGDQFSDYGYDNAESYAESFNKRLTEKLSQLSGVKINAESGTLESTATKNLGLNIKEVTQYASQLASVTNSVGQTGEVSLATASAFTKLGADMSSLFNMDYSQVMNNLQSGLIGQSRALYRYGIDITNATLQTLAYELGVEKAVSEMTQAEKMQLRLIAILDQSRVSWGDQANTINSTSNQIRLFKNNLSETGMILGQLFIPILNNLLPALNGLSIAFKRLLTDIAGFMGISIDLDSFGQGYSGIEDDINAEADAYDNATESAKKYRNQILSFDDATKLQDTDSDSSGSGASGSINLENEILKATEEYEKAWQEAYDKMENRAEQFADKFEVMLEPIRSIFENIAIGDWFAVGEDVGNLAKDILSFINKAIKKVDGEKVGESIGQFLQGIDWAGVIKEGVKLKVGLGLLLAEVWLESFDSAPLETGIITALGAMTFTPLGGIVGKKIGAALTGSAAVVAITGAFKSLGGIGGILTFDLATVIGAGSFAEIGITIATGLVGSIIAGFVGYNIGEEIYKLITGDKTDYDWSDYIGENFNADDWKAGWEMTVDDWKAGWEIIIESILDESHRANGMLIDFHNSLEEWLDENVISWGLGMDIISGNFSEKWSGIKDDWKTGMKTIADSVSTKWTDMKDSWSLGIDTIKTSFSGFWETVKTWFGAENWTLSGIKDGLSEAFTNAIDALKGIWNGFATWINKALNFEFEGFEEEFSVFGKKIEVGLPSFEVSLGNLPTFQTGGFPEDGLFFANHNELVGQFSNGQTAVANNEQIVQGIAQGIAPAVYNAVLSAMRDSTTNGNGDTVVMIDGKEVFRAVKKQADNYTISTGETAFLM